MPDQKDSRLVPLSCLAMDFQLLVSKTRRGLLLPSYISGRDEKTGTELTGIATGRVVTSSEKTKIEKHSPVKARWNASGFWVLPEW